MISDTQLQIFWNDANAQSVTFELERATKPGGPYVVIATNLTSKIYDDKSLSASTQYCYRVRAKNNLGATRAIATKPVVPRKPRL
ncbi:hypothetical protein GO730_20050 [Spirosoma sp. HMF3257]|uniref:Fibronectin type-III domain-containing protein n=1 Tax=Spirosoma telluris TaxID=2183553 RepID=A0A327NKH4_9BACT|nr:hypothetical protein [Spirosoma telluris]RAI75871.1 hypothetical protein HMF3257_19980 [Spirosoma telluris]